MRRIVLALLCLGFVATLPGMAADDKKDQDALKGTWKITKLSANGQNPPDAENAFLHFTADEVAPEIGGNRRPAAKYKLDSGKSPKQIEVNTPEGDNMQGIYEIKEDTLKLSLKRGGGRPGSFDETGEGIITIEAKREKK